MLNKHFDQNWMENVCVVSLLEYELSTLEWLKSSKICVGHLLDALTFGDFRKSCFIFQIVPLFHLQKQHKKNVFANDEHWEFLEHSE